MKSQILGCLLLFAFASAFSLNANAETVKLYEDGTIRDIARKHLKKDLLENGTLRDLAAHNRLSIKEWTGSSVDDLFQLVGLDKKRVLPIEGAAINAWSITRCQVSPSYDLILDCSVTYPGKEPRLALRAAFFAPHRDKKYEGDLLDENRWDKIRFGEDGAKLRLPQPANEAKFTGFPTYVKGSTAIYQELPGGPFDADLPRKIKHLAAQEIISRSDGFLKQVFGNDFHAPFFKLSLERCRGSDGDYAWCWIVGYYDPDSLQDIDTARVFFVLLDMKGKPLMRVERDYKSEKQTNDAKPRKHQ